MPPGDRPARRAGRPGGAAGGGASRGGGRGDDRSRSGGPRGAAGGGGGGRNDRPRGAGAGVPGSARRSGPRPDGGRAGERRDDRPRRPGAPTDRTGRPRRPGDDRREDRPGRPGGAGRPGRARGGEDERRDDRPGAPRRAPGSGGRGRGPAADSPATASWGGVARRGARNLEEPKPGTAAAAWRDAAAKADRDRASKRSRPTDDAETWIDAGPVRDEASAAVARAEAPAAPARPPRKRREVPAEVADEVARAAGPAWAGRVKERLADAARAYEAERYRDARRILEQLIDRAPSAVAVRELLGLTYYRLGKWRDAIRELGAVELISGSVEHHPVIADCHRALRQLDEVERLWDELRRAGASVGVVIEGRIVLAGAYADAGRVADAVAVLEQGPVDVRKPQDHHLRLWYALASLYERAGDVPRARALFLRLVRAAPDFADALDRLEALGG